MSDALGSVGEIVVGIPKYPEERLLHLRPLLSRRCLSVERPLVAVGTVLYEIPLNFYRGLLAFLRRLVERAQILLIPYCFEGVGVVREHG